MPGFVCAVAICKSNSEKAKKIGQHISFHSFPTDKLLLKEWVRRCYRQDKFDPKHKKICSEHFVNDDYEDAIQAKIMNVMPKRLKKDAIPTLNLKLKQALNNDIQPSERVTKYRKKEHAELLKNVFEEYEPKVEQTLEDININDLPGSSSETDYDKLKRSYETLIEEHHEAKKQIAELNSRNYNLQRENEKVKRNIEVHANDILASFLSKNQIDILLEKKKKVRWTEEEISRAFTLRYFGKRGYIYVRQKLKYPLPGISTLQRWASNMNLRDGILKDILRVMSTCGQTKTVLQKLTVLSYDEMKVSSIYEFDQQKDEIVGEHKYMQVVMARGLIDPWKQPIFVDFDTKITKAVLDELLEELHKINFHVIACVSDCGGSNMGLWRELDIGMNKTYYLHPASKEKIYFFADVPHLLKLVRNWLIDSGFVLENGTLITKQPIEVLIQSTDSEISSCHKLSQHHLTCEKAQRQNVAKAAQVFSNTTVTALKRYFPGVKEAEDVATFLEMVGTWFDIMNSYTPNASVPTKRPYGGSNIDQQNITLNKMKTTFASMRCRNKNGLQIFQKGVYISTSSLQDLYADISQKYGIKYILTHRLNQDCLENLFFQVRAKGGLHDHPSPLHSLYRLRMILLGKNPGLVQKHTNVPLEEDNEFLLTTALRKVRIKCPNILDTKETQGYEDNESVVSVASSSSSSVSSTRNVAEADGLIYIAGYLAKKFKDKYPDLGKYTYQTEELMHTYSMPSWVQHLSFGGLIEPSKQWSEHVFKMEHQFKKIHKSKFSFKSNIIEETMAQILRKIKDVPEDLVKAFVRQRVFVRIKYLNNAKQVSSLKRSHQDTEGSQRKSIKKIKKTIT